MWQHTFRVSVWHCDILGLLCSFALLKFALLCLPIIHIHIAIWQGCIMYRVGRHEFSQDWPVCLLRHTTSAGALPGRLWLAVVRVQHTKAPS